jgi:hypothetical protein
VPRSGFVAWRTHALERWLTTVLHTLGRILPAERRDWLTAMTSESESLPAGYQRLAWLLGAVPLLVREVGRMRPVRQPLIIAVLIVAPLLGLPFGVVTALVVLAVAAAVALVISTRRRERVPTGGPGQPAWIPRIAVFGAAIAVAALTIAVGTHYPQVFDGAGTPIFVALLVLLLAGYATATWLLTRTGSAIAGPALIGGVIAAALWTVGAPAGGTYDMRNGWPTVLYTIGLVLAFAGPPAIAAAFVARRHDLAAGIAAGALTGGYAALANLVGGLILVMAVPGRVPADSDVLAHYHTATEILGANVGEDLAGFIMLMIGWPAAGLLISTIASVLGRASSHRPTPSTPGPDLSTATG